MIFVLTIVVTAVLCFSVADYLDRLEARMMREWSRRLAHDQLAAEAAGELQKEREQFESE